MILPDATLGILGGGQLGRMTAMVPVSTAETVGLRKLVCPDDCERVIEFLSEEGCSDESENWNQRYRDNLNKLRVGDIYGVARVCAAWHVPKSTFYAQRAQSRYKRALS